MSANPSPRIAVIGGGPAGIAAALRLQQAGFAAITVVEAGDYTAPKIGETLPPPCQRELQTLGLWEAFAADAHLPATLSASAWGSGTVEFNDFLFRPVGRGWHLDRAKFDRRLAALAEERSIVVRRNTRLGQVVGRPAGWQLELVASDGSSQPLECDFAIDASGRKAVFARTQGAETIHFDELFGCSRFFDFPESARPRAGHTLVESVPHGWWYSAQLPDRRFVAAFMTDGDTVRTLRTHEPEGWQQALAESTPTLARLDGLRPLGRPQVAAAHSQMLDALHGDRWLAAGDAAAAYDPLSSMGIHQALRGGIAAGDAIAAHFGGDSGALSRYAAVLRQFYRRYLEVKADYYRVERRWPREPFWVARHQAVYLSPHHRLRAVAGSTAATLRCHLGARSYAEIFRRCAEPLPAHEVVEDFQRRHADEYSDLQVILALQHAIERHQLAVVAPG